MTDNVEQPQDNDTPVEKKTATVSVRNMNLKLWYEIGYLAKREGVTMTHYITEILEEHLSNK